MAGTAPSARRSGSCKRTSRKRQSLRAPLRSAGATRTSRISPAALQFALLLPFGPRSFTRSSPSLRRRRRGASSLRGRSCWPCIGICTSFAFTSWRTRTELSTSSSTSCTTSIRRRTFSCVPSPHRMHAFDLKLSTQIRPAEYRWLGLFALLCCPFPRPAFLPPALCTPSTLPLPRAHRSVQTLPFRCDQHPSLIEVVPHAHGLRCARLAACPLPAAALTSYRLPYACSRPTSSRTSRTSAPSSR